MGKTQAELAFETADLTLFETIGAWPHGPPGVHLGAIRPNTYIDATRGRSIPQEFIAYHVVPVVKKEKPLQDTFAETLCYNIMLGEVILPLVASMYVLGPLEQRADAAVVGIEDAVVDLGHVAAGVDLDLSHAD